MAEPSFTGFTPGAFRWFDGIEEHNSRVWFAEHRHTYDAEVRGALEAFLEELADELGGEVTLFRQHRDTRFSADKSPYKTSSYGLIVDRPRSLAPLYAQLSGIGLFAGTGYYAFAADQLARFRDAVADDVTGPELERVIAGAHAARVETFGEALKTAPRGYARDHPRVWLLRHKSLVAGARCAPAPHGGGIARDVALDHARATWETCAPLNAWLDAHVGPSTLPAEARAGARARR